jgi:AcrR family transcriptional regulator
MDRRIIKTQSVIRNAFLTKLVSSDLDDISIDLLCQEANINRSTFYSHYNNIYDLFESIENEFILKFQEFAVDIRQEDSSISNVLYSILTYVKEHGQALVTIIKSPNSVFLNRILQDYKPKSYEEWNKWHDYGSLNSFEYCFSFIANGCIALITSWIENGMKEDVGFITQLAERLMNTKY